MKASLPIILWLIQACDVPVIRPEAVGLGDLSDAACPRGLAIAATDYKSTNIGAIDLSGNVLSPSLISSASHSVGLTSALSGDVGFPSTRASGNELVVLDRSLASVITWVNIETATVRAQLSVATGFNANPHDYVSIAPNKAYVTRFGSNSNAGREPYDEGHDILVLDPSIPAIKGRIDAASGLPPYAGYNPSPDCARLAGDRLYVVVPYYDSAYHAGPSYVIAIDPATDAPVDQILLAGLSGCSGLDISPDQTSIAIACSGRWQGSSSADASASALVGLRIRPQMEEIWRIPASRSTKRAFGFALGFVDSTHVIASQLGEFGPPMINDTVYLIDTNTSASTPVLQSANVPFTLSVGPCDADCGVCFLVDTQRVGIFEFTLSQSNSFSLTEYPWNDPTGLPPRLLGFF